MNANKRLSRRRLTGVAALSALALLCSAQPVSAAETTSAADTFGAIAYSTTNGAAGYSWGFANREIAQTTAVGFCTQAGGVNCKWVLWIQNNWGALATGSNRAYGVGWSPNVDAAKFQALQSCNATGATNCTLRRVIHSSHG